jgi:transposase-like protein
VVAGEPQRVTRNGRRYFSAAHREAVVAQCLKPGASLAAVALANGFNANLVRKWVRNARQCDGMAQAAPTLLPVILQDEVPERVSPPAPSDETGHTVADGRLLLCVGKIELQVHGVVDRSQLALVLDTLMRTR